MDQNFLGGADKFPWAGCRSVISSGCLDCSANEKVDADGDNCGGQRLGSESSSCTPCPARSLSTYWRAAGIWRPACLKTAEAIHR